MTQYYLDIDTNSQEDLCKIFGIVHLALVRSIGNIATSFPEFEFNHQLNRGQIGKSLRLIADSKEELEQLDLSSIELKLDFEVSISEVLPVPEQVIAYCTFSRAIKRSGSRARRHAKRAVAAGRYANYEEALAATSKFKDYSPLPFIKTFSRSSGREMFIYVSATLKQNPVKGQFTKYGLSSEATVPLF